MTSSIAYLNSFDWLGSRLGLSRIQALMELLGNPQDELQFVHLAGTNGKGSTACFLSYILHSAGYRTGLYTSPFIHSFHERMQVDFKPIRDDVLDRIVARVRKFADTMEDHPTTFELVTAVALVWFAETKCDIVILETGMGGSLDATNVISTHVLALITPIDMDHMAFLGNTISEIAAQKAGIIKHKRPVISANQRPEAETVLRAFAAERDAPFQVVDTSSLTHLSHDLYGQVFSFGDFHQLSIRMLGHYQAENAALAIAGAKILSENGFPISPEQIRKGLGDTAWPGRFEICAIRPHIIVDGGHNRQGAAALVHNLERYFPGKKAIFVMGILADKDCQSIIEPILPKAEMIYTITPANPRAMEAQTLADMLSKQGVPAQATPDVKTALAHARSRAGTDGLVCCCGSLYSVGAMRTALGLYKLQ